MNILYVFLTIVIFNVCFSQCDIKESSQWKEFIVPFLNEKFDYKDEDVFLFQNEIKSYPFDFKDLSFVYKFLRKEKGLHKKQFERLYNAWMDNWLMVPDYWKVSDLTYFEKDSILSNYLLDGKTLWNFYSEDFLILGISPICLLPKKSYFFYVEYFSPTNDKHLTFYLMNWSDRLNKYEIYYSMGE